MVNIKKDPKLYCSCGRPVSELTALFTMDMDEEVLCIECHNYLNYGKHSWAKDPAFDKWLKEHKEKQLDLITL